MEEDQRRGGSGLFLIRLWLPEDRQGEWSGRAIHITSGRAGNFVQLATLGALLSEMLGIGASADGAPAPTPAAGATEEQPALP